MIVKIKLRFITMVWPLAPTIQDLFRPYYFLGTPHGLCCAHFSNAHPYYFLKREREREREKKHQQLISKDFVDFSNAHPYYFPTPTLINSRLVPPLLFSREREREREREKKKKHQQLISKDFVDFLICNLSKKILAWFFYFIFCQTNLLN